MTISPPASIEAEVLRYDRRRIGRLQAFLPADFCHQAARLMLQTDGPVLIATGFYIAHAGKPETDGPPGALALAMGLERLGRSVAFVTDEPCASMMDRLRGGRPLHVMPLGSAEAAASANGILATVRPALMIAIERCGPDAEGRFLQFDGTDISSFTGRLEHLFAHDVPSLGVVDGGNEIGIGAIAEIVSRLDGLPASPCVTPTDGIVLGGIANWGCYGVLAALSRLTGRPLLLEPAEEEDLRAATVAAGAVDGDSGEAISAVDGYPGELSRLVVERLHRLIEI